MRHHVEMVNDTKMIDISFSMAHAVRYVILRLRPRLVFLFILLYVNLTAINHIFINFDFCIIRLQNAVQQIISWMILTLSNMESPGSQNARPLRFKSNVDLDLPITNVS